MAMKDLLVLLETGENGARVNAFALALSELLGAHLTGAGVVMDIVPPASFMGEYPADILLDISEQARKDIEAQYQKLKDAAGPDQQTDLVVIQSYPNWARTEFGRLARHFDLTILGQSRESGDEVELLAEGALFGSGRPVLIVPTIQKAPPKLGKVLIAYDGSANCARAISDALPLLKRSGHVELVTVADSDSQPNDLPGFNMTRHLARHKIQATLKKLPPTDDIGASILSYATDMGADFLVMGAYGHSRLREFVLGGTTRSVFAAMTIPVFMSH